MTGRLHVGWSLVLCDAWEYFILASMW